MGISIAVSKGYFSLCEPNPEALYECIHQALEDERLKKKSIQKEKEALERHVAELELRYAEKAR